MKFEWQGRKHVFLAYLLHTHNVKSLALYIYGWINPLDELLLKYYFSDNQTDLENPCS